jgi:aldehyde dehydrogenase (NAD+)
MSTDSSAPALAEIHTSLFARQRAHAPVVARRTAAERLAVLGRLRAALLRYQPAIEAALLADFRKHPAETTLSELLPVQSELAYTRRNLRRWMRPQGVVPVLSRLGTSAYLTHEPKGNVLIISPWNYPINLSLTPLIQAVAAGNVVVLKPSELTPHSTAVLRDLIGAVFPPEEVAVVEGDATTAQALLTLPFDHIFFTGSTAVGKKVMAAAARNLASVTLELGGKSPVVIDASADIPTAARRVAWAKCVNAGQTCVAPDYVLVHERVREVFIAAFEEAVRKLYPAGVAQSDDYARIIDDRHVDRLRGYLAEALEGGARVGAGGEVNRADRFIAPTLLTEVPADSALLREEIFGPLLPLISFSDRDEVVREIRSRDKPLALYLFGRDNQRLGYWLDRLSAGGVVINDAVVQYGYPGLPWGGVNQSGLGKSGGRFGFREFSNERGVVRQHWGLYRLLYPPYTAAVRGLMNRVLRYL